MRIGVPFRNIHAALNPKNRRQVAPAPGNYPAQQNAAPAQTRDLLGFDSPVVSSGSGWSRDELSIK